MHVCLSSSQLTHEANGNLSKNWISNKRINCDQRNFIQPQYLNGFRFIPFTVETWAEPNRAAMHSIIFQYMYLGVWCVCVAKFCFGLIPIFYIRLHTFHLNEDIGMSDTLHASKIVVRSQPRTTCAHLCSIVCVLGNWVQCQVGWEKSLFWKWKSQIDQMCAMWERCLILGTSLKIGANRNSISSMEFN